ncbi:ATP-dependent RNA helicase CsdA [Corynebacterium appendicis CIP 107643]|uniref:ATP-dependent RNA helicase DeaD n=1 Tax=Corynebacterium appendicis CIP 107643 TaxID=1161099 RepID=A0A1N7KDL9_9CORY|nr:DEAD/DEAH box helicase [Corynebacterium appendicis]WJY60851.1 ATP-dependent RNA helicase DeaD [Corynebacterium appendicis CIP 107643]SIS59671.1 ATP-dependent RNA helicase CsdA [Corynebacterium appendicis CIP 107643]
MSIDDNAAEDQQANTPAETENTDGSNADQVQSSHEAQTQGETENVSDAAGTAEENGNVNNTGAADEAAEQNNNENPVEGSAEVATGNVNENSAEKDGGKGTEEASSSTGFDALDLSGDLLTAIKKVGFEEPSPIQAQTIPLLLEGRDVVGLAQTGTGKTAAFALPVLAQIDTKARHPQALVLAPTRELALQVSDSFQSFADHLGGVSVLPIYGGQAYGIQLSGLRRGAQVIVGTPGRVIDHLEKGSLDISNLRFLVLDEADEMLNMGFQEDVERILEDTPNDKQVALFSATMPNGIRRISKQYLNDPAEVTVKSETRTNTNITQRYLFTAHRNKLDAITRILEVTEFDGMIVFVRTKHETEEIAEKLRARGFSAAAINGDIAQQQRERTVDQLRDGRLDILVATDVAARGLDVERISHVLNYDIPNDTESYVHRIGRTGRAGRTGEAILFVTPRERRMLRSIEKVTGAEIEEMDLPTVDEVNVSRMAKFSDSITESLENDQMDLFRSLVRSYSADHDVPMEDIAAALAAQTSGDEFLMKEPPKDKRDRRDREKWDRDDRRDRGRGRDRRDRDDRGGRSRYQNDDPNFDTYRLDVGKRQHVRPGAIVGALANEGGLTNRDFGRITIGGDFTLVELPKNLDPAVLDRLTDTRISGQLINIQRDHGAPPRDRRGGRGGYRKRDDDRGYRGGGRGRGGHGSRDRDDRGGRGGRGGGRDRGWRD